MTAPLIARATGILSTQREVFNGTRRQVIPAQVEYDTTGLSPGFFELSNGVPNGNIIVRESGFYRFTAKVAYGPEVRAGRNVSEYLNLHQFNDNGTVNFYASKNYGNNNAITNYTPHILNDVVLEVDCSNGPKYFCWSTHYNQSVVGGTPLATMNLVADPLEATFTVQKLPDNPVAARATGVSNNTFTNSTWRGIAPAALDYDTHPNKLFNISGTSGGPTGYITIRESGYYRFRGHITFEPNHPDYGNTGIMIAVQDVGTGDRIRYGENNQVPGCHPIAFLDDVVRIVIPAGGSRSFIFMARYTNSTIPTLDAESSSTYSAFEVEKVGDLEGGANVPLIARGYGMRSDLNRNVFQNSVWKPVFPDGIDFDTDPNNLFQKYTDGTSTSYITIREPGYYRFRGQVSFMPQSTSGGLMLSLQDRGYSGDIDTMVAYGEANSVPNYRPQAIVDEVIHVDTPSGGIHYYQFKARYTNPSVASQINTLDGPFTNLSVEKVGDLI